MGNKKIHSKNIVELGDMVRIANNSAEGKKIYFVKMNLSDMVNRIQNTTHELRPFVSVEKVSDDQIKGFYTTSNLKGLEFSEECFSKYRTVLSNKKYKLNKSSIVLIDKFALLKKENILREIDTIDNNDLVNILKMRNLYLGNFVNLKGKYLDIGDIIIKENNLYLIYQCDNSFCYGFKIENKGSVTKSRIDIKNSYDYFVYENNIYKVFFNESKRFSKNDNYLLYDKLLFDIVNFIKKNRKSKSYKAKQKRRYK